MNAVNPLPAGGRRFMSGNEAVARGAWEAGCKVAAAYPGTPSTEILEYASQYPEMYTEWSVNRNITNVNYVDAVTACNAESNGNPD